MTEKASAKKRKNTHISVTLSKIQVKELKRIALADDLQLSQLVRKAVTAWLTGRATPDTTLELA